MATNAVLFYFQMWKPMVEEEEMEERKSAEEVVEKVEIMEEEEGRAVCRNANDNVLKETKVREAVMYMILEREGGQRPFQAT